MKGGDLHSGSVLASDEELMKAYQTGDDAAFTALFNRYSGRVLAFLSKKLGQGQVAQELAQEVFLKLHRSRGRYTPDLPFAPWLFSITRNVSIDYLRKNNVEIPTEQITLERRLPPAEDTGNRIDPAEHLGHLLPNQRTAVSMKVLDEVSFEEIAARLGTSSANARQLVSRGLRYLREVLKHRGGD